MRLVTRSSPGAPWRPFHSVERLRSLLDELSDGFERGIPSEVPWSPAVEVAETDAELKLTAELPGMDKTDVEIEVEKDVLTIRGEKNEEHEVADEKRRYHVWERSYGKFSRSFTLPGSVDADKIYAEFDRGVLVIRILKKAAAKARRIEIAAGKQDSGDRGSRGVSGLPDFLEMAIDEF
jgi:HSP20 family protein